MRTCILAIAFGAMACGRYSSTATVTIAVTGPGAVRTTALQGDCHATCWFTVGREVPVQLEPIADARSVFAGWTGACHGTGACELTPGYDVSVAATFRPATPRRLQVSLNGAGAVRSDPPGIDCPRSCAADFPEGTAVSLQPTPADGWSFNGFDGACSGTACRIELFGDTAAAANFLQGAVELAVEVSGAGSVVSKPAAIQCPGVCSATFAPNTTVTLTVTTPAGATFAGYSGACSGQSCSLRLDRAARVAASFSTIPVFKVAVVPAGAGIGRVTSTPPGIDCPGACAASFPDGTGVTLSAAADALSRFTGFAGSCSGARCELTLRADAAVVAQFDQRRYALVDLGVPTGGYGSSAAAISRHGTLIAGSGDRPQLLFWDGTLHDGAIAPVYTTGVNAAGVVVGSWPGLTDWHGLRWEAGRATDLGTLGGRGSAAYAINDDGIIAGWAQRADGIQRAVAWGPRGIVDLGSLAKDSCSVAYGINSKGVIVGSTCTVAAGVRAARFRAPDLIDDLGSFGGTTVALAISDSGLIVGYSYLPSGAYHGFLHADGKMIDVGTLPGMTQSQLAAVNSAGIAVGLAADEGGLLTAVVYGAGRMADLNSLVESNAYTLIAASGIDEDGNIVANARLSGWSRAVLLRPQ